MNKRLKALSCAIVTIFALTISPISPNVGPFNVDVVSAATGDAPVVTPPKASTPSKSSNSGKTNTSNSSNTSYAPTVATSFTRLLKLGSTGIDVTFLQVRLSMYGYGLNADGVYGKSTYSAVKSFQSKHSLKADGIASMATLAKLTPKVIVKTIPTSILKLGSTGGDVKLLQTRLSMFGYRLYGDGVFGNLTLTAVKNFQSKHYLTADGIVGAKTIAKLFAKAVVKPVKPVKPPVVPPVVVVPPVDVVTAASLVDTAAVFEKSIGKDGKWIVCATKDITSTKDLLLEGEFKNGKKDAVTGAELIQRKIALYTQDDKHVVTAKFTLTAPKLTVSSPNASLEHGTFKGDLYVTSKDFKLIDQTVVGDVYVSATNFSLSKESKIQGNVYFSTQGSKDAFKLLDTSSVTGTQDLLVVDAVATASIVKDADAFEKAISKDGKWIATSLGDITTTKELVVEGLLKKAEKDPKPARKIGLYTQAKQDGVNVVTAKFTLTAPKLTIKSPEAKIQSSNFKGDLVVASRNFLLTDSTVTGNVYVHSTEFTLSANAKIIGNVYFDNIEAQNTFIDGGCTITGTQTLLAEPSMVDSVASASLVDNAADFEKAISKDGTWIICPVKDMVIDKDLVLEGTLYNKKTPPAIARKIGIYFHDDDQYTTAKFTLKAKSLTIKSPKATIQKGTFIGDLYIAVDGFTLKETKIIGNVYFATQAIKDAFDASPTSIDSLSSISGTQTVGTK